MLDHVSPTGLHAVLESRLPSALTHPLFHLVRQKKATEHTM